MFYPSLYRTTLAKLLVTASRVKQLRGQEQLRYERRRGPPYYNGAPDEGR